MRLTAIIAEYNPLHTGHIHHIDVTKAALPCDALAIVMSGNFTQRGDVAVAEKHTRAEAAIRAGADIVVELPFVYAVNCAEKFADGAMKILSCFNTPLTVSFGSECGDVKKLEEISLKAHNETEYDKAVIKGRLDKGEGLVRARAAAIGNEEVFCPNNILAIEYIRAAKQYGFDCFTMPRKGSYSSTETGDEYASANAIRENIFLGNFDKIARFLPDFMQNCLTNCISNEALADMVLYKIKLLGSDEIKRLYEVTEGLENRIFSVAKSVATYKDLCDGIKSKRYTMARIKRILLYVLSDLTKDKLNGFYSAPPYARVLAVKRGREDILSLLSNPVVKYSDATRLPTISQELLSFENKVDDIYSVASKTPAEFNCRFI